MLSRSMRILMISAPVSVALALLLGASGYHRITVSMAPATRGFGLRRASTSADDGHAAFVATVDSSMATMHAAMRAALDAPLGGADAAFAAAMIPHHQGAIDMARAELRHGVNEQLRRLAQEIIVTQQQEIAVLRLVAQGLTDAQVAEKLVLSPRTVSTHLTSIYGKLQVNSRSAATRFAVENGVV